MKVWHFEWGNGDYVCHHEDFVSACHTVARDIVDNGRAPVYDNDYGKVYDALHSEGVEIKECQTIFFQYADSSKVFPK